MPEADVARQSQSFDPVIDKVTAQVRARFAERLGPLRRGLRAGEAERITATVDATLRANAAFKLNRVLLLELHAARRVGVLTDPDEVRGFRQFVDLAVGEAFHVHLEKRYPALPARLNHALSAQERALGDLVARFVADRDILSTLPDAPGGALLSLSPGQGDLHAGGQAVARLTLETGEVIYKPRSLRIDGVLEGVLSRLFGEDPDRIRVPAVLDRGEYGWAAFIAHRYCRDEGELARFYRNLGHWLAVLRLLGGTDIHQENLIAHGPVPVVIDVESLFAPMPRAAPAGNGDAYDRATDLIRKSVLRTGIVPYRTQALGFAGVDYSAAGGLPGQQPKVHVPVIAREGTTGAHLAVADMDVEAARNHPSPSPDVSRHWNQLSEGFLDVTDRLRRLDDAGALAPLLAPFAGCLARDIRRATQAYVEIGRMLWHPASLHDEAKAVERARDLLTRNAAVMPQAPSDPREIQGEIDDLRLGDVPIFAAPLDQTRIDAALRDWRAQRVELEDLTIRSALVATHLNVREDQPETERDARRLAAHRPRTDDLDGRRRRQAAAAMERLLRLAVAGEDGSLTWITPEVSPAGWQVRPLSSDLYYGLAGIMVALATYHHEMAAGRVPAIDGVDQALAGVARSMIAMTARERVGMVGAFTGVGGQIWAWLTLHDLGLDPGPEGDGASLAQAIAAATRLEAHGFATDTTLDILGGAAGAIPPLLNLADATGDARWSDLAARAAHHLAATAIQEDGQVYWPNERIPEPITGFAHGSTGIAWALTRMVLAGAGDAAARARWTELARRGFAFQAAHYDDGAGNWFISQQGIRRESFHNWCYGSIGVGLAAGDLHHRTGEDIYLHTLRRAVTGARGRWGASHTLCHGDFSLGEFMTRAALWDPDGCPPDDIPIAAPILSSIEEQGGVVGGMARAAFTPGLMTGLAGAVHSLCRLHPDCHLSSPLLLERMAG